MGFLAASASICYFHVEGSFNNQHDDTELQQRLADEGFRSIEQSGEELSTGWVQLEDYENSDFHSQQVFQRDQHLCFTLRQDRRRIPAALYKREITRLSKQFLADKPNLKRVPNGEMEQIRDRARSLLMSRTLPSPSYYDVIWDTERQFIRLCSLSQKVIDSFQGLFHQTFPGFRLQLLHPMARASQLLPAALQEKLAEANLAQTDSALEQIEANRWLGSEFLQWLFFRTLNSDAHYAIDCPGPFLENQPFTAYLDNRLILVGGGQEGVQKIVVAGPQDHYTEVRAALQQGKQIEEATLHLENDEDEWKLTLKGERFQFGSYRTPMIRPEAGPDDDLQAEAEAAFYTKLGAIEEGEQMFNSLLKKFMELRLGEDWKNEQKAMNDWVAGSLLMR